MTLAQCAAEAAGEPGRWVYRPTITAPAVSTVPGAAHGRHEEGRPFSKVVSEYWDSWAGHTPSSGRSPNSSDHRFEAQSVMTPSWSVEPSSLGPAQTSTADTEAAFGLPSRIDEEPEVVPSARPRKEADGRRRRKQRPASSGSGRHARPALPPGRLLVIEAEQAELKLRVANLLGGTGAAKPPVHRGRLTVLEAEQANLERRLLRMQGAGRGAASGDRRGGGASDSSLE